MFGSPLLTFKVNWIPILENRSARKRAHGSLGSLPPLFFPELSRATLFQRFIQTFTGVYQLEPELVHFLKFNPQGVYLGKRKVYFPKLLGSWV